MKILPYSRKTSLREIFTHVNTFLMETIADFSTEYIRLDSKYNDVRPIFQE